MITIAKPIKESVEICSPRKRKVHSGAMTGSDRAIKLACSALVYLMPIVKQYQAPKQVRNAKISRNIQS